MTEFRVAGLTPQDAGRGIARLTGAGREELGVEPGDTVTITGRRRTVAKVAVGYQNDDADVVRIDGNVRTNADVNLDELAENTEGYTGGDIEAVVREASMLAMDETILELGDDGRDVDESKIDEVTEGLTVSREQFRNALRKIKPSVTEARREFYEEMVNELGGKTEADSDEAGLGFQ